MVFSLKKMYLNKFQGKEFNFELYHFDRWLLNNVFISFFMIMLADNSVDVYLSWFVMAFLYIKKQIFLLMFCMYEITSKGSK